MQVQQQTAFVCPHPRHSYAHTSTTAHSQRPSRRTAPMPLFSIQPHMSCCGAAPATTWPPITPPLRRAPAPPYLAAGAAQPVRQVPQQARRRLLVVLIQRRVHLARACAGGAVVRRLQGFRDGFKHRSERWDMMTRLIRLHVTSSSRNMPPPPLVPGAAGFAAPAASAPPPAVPPPLPPPPVAVSATDSRNASDSSVRCPPAAGRTRGYVTRHPNRADAGLAWSPAEPTRVFALGM